jgi:23S rRNA (guanine745-N1)-methyltransferase
MSLFICPVCAQPLNKGQKAYTCPRGHAFDIAAQGYANLLRPDRMRTKQPGDSQGMVASRRAFLDKGYFSCLQQAVCDCTAGLADGRADFTALDSGCGEGYYTGAVFRALNKKVPRTRMAGVDISKYAVRLAARREPGVQFAVASVFSLPLEDESVNLLLNIFSPLSVSEFRRVLRPGGFFVYAVPAAKHLWGLKEVLYDTPVENEERRIAYDGFVYRDVVPIKEEILLASREDIQNLFAMTPYYWKTPREGALSLAEHDTLKTEISFFLHVFERKT